MKTHNWQTKALTLFIAAAVLCLISACRDADIDENTGTEYTDPERITPSIPCGSQVRLRESVEFRRLPDDASMAQRGLAAIAREKRLSGRRGFIEAILDEYEDLLHWHSIGSPDGEGVIHGWGVASIWNDNGELTDKQVIEIRVTKYVDQSTLPPEEQIPECIDGVEVHIEVSPGATFD